MHVSNSMQHTYQEGLETWQELHSVQLQCLIELVALRYSVNGERQGCHSVLILIALKLHCMQVAALV